MGIHTLTGHPFIELSVIAVILVILAVVIMSGKGDFLIAGYNTASEEEKKQFNIKRLRFIITVLLGISVLYVIAIPYLYEKMILLTFVFLVISIVSIILANTWAKNKN